MRTRSTKRLVQVAMIAMRRGGGNGEAQPASEYRTCAECGVWAEAAVAPFVFWRFFLAIPAASLPSSRVHEQYDEQEHSGGLGDDDKRADAEPVQGRQ